MQYAVLLALALAPVLALGIQLARAPDTGFPEAGQYKPRALGPFIAGLISTPQSSQFECTVDEVNALLAQALPAAGTRAKGLAFQRLAVRLEPERCHVIALYRWKGMELHLQLEYLVQLQNGRIQWKPLSGSLGRVALGPFWLKRLQEPLWKLLPALKKEVVLMNRLEALRLEPMRVFLKVRASTPAKQTAP